MREAEFREWLLEVDKKSKAQTSDNVSRVKRIEKAFTDTDGTLCDVDKEYEKDGCASLFERLATKNRTNLPEQMNLPHDMMGLSRLKSSLRKYIEFYCFDKSR